MTSNTVSCELLYLVLWKCGLYVSSLCKQVNKTKPLSCVCLKLLCKAQKIMGEEKELKINYINEQLDSLNKSLHIKVSGHSSELNQMSWWPYQKNRHSLKSHYDEESRQLCIACLPPAFREGTGKGNGSVDKSIFCANFSVFHCVVNLYLKTSPGEITYLIWLSTRDYLGREHVALQVVAMTSLEDWCTWHNRDMTENYFLVFKTWNKVYLIRFVLCNFCFFFIKTVSVL